MPAKKWLIEGKYVEYCSCDHDLTVERQGL